MISAEFFGVALPNTRMKSLLPAWWNVTMLPWEVQSKLVFDISLGNLPDLTVKPSLKVYSLGQNTLLFKETSYMCLFLGNFRQGWFLWSLESYCPISCGGGLCPLTVFDQIEKCIWSVVVMPPLTGKSSKKLVLFIIGLQEKSWSWISILSSDVEFFGCSLPNTTMPPRSKKDVFKHVSWMVFAWEFLKSLPWLVWMMLPPCWKPMKFQTLWRSIQYLPIVDIHIERAISWNKHPQCCFK